MQAAAERNCNPLPQGSKRAATGRGIRTGRSAAPADYTASAPNRATVTALAHHARESHRLCARLAGFEPTGTPSVRMYSTDALELVARLTGQQVMRRRIGNLNDWVVIVDGVEFWVSFNGGKGA